MSNKKVDEFIASLEPIGSAEAIYDFEADSDGTELSFKKGDSVKIIRKFDNGWWAAIIDGKLGHVPSNFVREHHNSSHSAGSTDGSRPSAVKFSAEPTSARASATASASASSLPSASSDAPPVVPRRTASLMSPNKLEDFRTKATLELYQTEEVYLDNLRVLCDVWAVPLRQRGLVKDDEIAAIFANIESIRDFTEKLLSDLKKALDNTPANNIPKLGDVFGKHAAEMKMVYIPYTLSNNNSTQTVTRLLKSNQKFAAFVKETILHERCNGRDLNAFLIAPVQRLPRYILLMDELLKYVPEELEDHKSMSQALAQLRAIAEKVNETKADSDTTKDVTRIYNVLVPQPADLLEPHRRFKMEGEIMFYEKKKLKPRYLFLFNDIILITQKDSAEKFSLLIWINLKSIILDTNQDWNKNDWPLTDEQTKMVANSFMLHTPKKSLLFFTDSPSSYTQWTTIMKQTYDDLLSA